MGSALPLQFPGRIVKDTVKPSFREMGLDGILTRAEKGEELSGDEVRGLLSIQEKEEGEALLSAARRVRARTTGGRVFLYGFVYLSTHCRNDCHFCYFRRSNPDPVRYRKNRSQVVEAASRLAASGVHLLDLTMGEDPFFLAEENVESLADLVAAVKEATGLPIMVSPGQVGDRALAVLKSAGASWYACYQETHNRALFNTIRPDQDFDARMEGKRLARKHGLLREEGILLGVGESPADIVHSLEVMGMHDFHQVRAMSFVPQTGTPFSDRPSGDSWEELKVMAVMRLLFPDRLIPASLDVAGLAGLRDRLNAGANVITSLVPPGEGWAGVAQSRLDIEEGRRTAESVEPVLASCGLVAATTGEYKEWVSRRMA